MEKTREGRKDYFAYDFDNNIEFFATEAEAKKAAENYLESARDMSGDDGWPEDVTDVCYGQLLGAVEQTSRTERPDDLDEDGNDPDGTHWEEHWDHMANYELLHAGGKQ